MTDDDRRRLEARIETARQTLDRQGGSYARAGVYHGVVIRGNPDVPAGGPVPAVFLTNPLFAPTGDEVEGGPAGFGASSTAQVPVVVLGPDRPDTGDVLQAYMVAGGRWVAGFSKHVTEPKVCCPSVPLLLLNDGYRTTILDRQPDPISPPPDGVPGQLWSGDDTRPFSDTYFADFPFCFNGIFRICSNYETNAECWIRFGLRCFKVRPDDSLSPYSYQLYGVAQDCRWFFEPPIPPATNCTYTPTGPYMRRNEPDPTGGPNPDPDLYRNGVILNMVLMESSCSPFRLRFQLQSIAYNGNLLINTPCIYDGTVPVCGTVRATYPLSTDPTPADFIIMLPPP